MFEKKFIFNIIFSGIAFHAVKPASVEKINDRNEYSKCLRIIPLQKRWNQWHYSQNSPTSACSANFQKSQKFFCFHINHYVDRCNAGVCCLLNFWCWHHSVCKKMIARLPIFLKSYVKTVWAKNLINGNSSCNARLCEESARCCTSRIIT